jgi:hypothetical protein
MFGIYHTENHRVAMLGHPFWPDNPKRYSTLEDECLESLRDGDKFRALHGPKATVEKVTFVDTWSAAKVPERVISNALIEP